MSQTSHIVRMLLHSTIPLQPAPRLWRIEGQHMCGLCGKRYANIKEAQTCLKHCFQLQVQKNNQIFTKVQGMFVRFQCGLCHKCYVHSQDAQHCLSGCIQRFSHLHSAEEQHIQPLQQTPATPAAKVTQQEGIVAVAPTPVKTGNNTKTENNPPADFDQKIFEDLNNKTTMPEPSQNTPAPEESPFQSKPNPEKIQFRKAGQAPFKRKDARYLCGACESGFFTKSEAEACFAAHPLQE